MHQQYLVLSMVAETSFNSELGNKLKELLPEWKEDILIEETKTLMESNAKHADILIVNNSIPPVVIETSFVKNDADLDAIARLGKHVRKNGREICTAIAIEWIDTDRQLTQLPNMLRYALHQKHHETRRRFPETGFLQGTVHDLIRFISTTSIPKEVMEDVANVVTKNVLAASDLLKTTIREVDLVAISKTLYQRSALSGLRTTMLLWLDSLLVQRQLYGGMYEIPSITHKPSECVDAWRTIYDINWKAIFKPAIDILDTTRMIAPGEVSEALKLLVDSVEEIEVARLGSDINIGAEIFPKIIDDRNESAAYYTQSSTAELLAALTITKDMCADWADSELFKKFKIADITCGTGTLLRFAYRQVKAYHTHNLHYNNNQTEKTNSLEKLHKSAMEYGLVGTDVSPIAAHLTSSSLAVDTRQPYGNTNIGWVSAGNENRTGSIEYIANNAIQDLLMGAVGSSVGSSEFHTVPGMEYNSVVIRDKSIDIILMNPPYSRTRGGQSAFDIAGLTEKERKDCQLRWGKLIKNEPCEKTAGMAATFLCVARKKIKPSGRIGFVLPRSAASDDTWQKTRSMIECDFKNIQVVAVTSALGSEAMSADTGKEEMLLTATSKTKSDYDDNDGGNATVPIKCTTLYRSITRLGESSEIARAIMMNTTGPIMLGDEEIGVSRIFHARYDGLPWNYVGVVHDDAAIIANELSRGVLYDLEGVQKKIPMSTIGELFEVGPTHDLIGHPVGGDERGAFKFYKVISETDSIGKYRSLWSADAQTQKSLIVNPTHKGTPYKSEEKEIKRMWITKSTLFYSRGMRWTSQSVLTATTKQPVMGGRAWVSLYHKNVQIRKVFALWVNSIYGMVVHWSRSSRADVGRAVIQVKGIAKIPCPQFDKFSDKKLKYAEVEFDKLCNVDLSPACMANKDENRHKINTVVSKILGVPQYDTAGLVKIWCAEPSVNGGKLN